MDSLCSIAPEVKRERSVADVLGTLHELSMQGLNATGSIKSKLGINAEPRPELAEPSCMYTHMQYVESMLADVVNNISEIQNRLG